MLNATCPVVSNFNVTPSGEQLFGNTTFRQWADQLWEKNKTGPYSIATGNAAAWLSFPVISPRAEEIADQLEEQDPAESLAKGTHSTVVAGYRAQMRSYAQAMRGKNTAFGNFDLTGGPGNGIIVDLHPLSRGTVNIDVSDPFWKEPVVDYRALSNPIDKLVMADIMRFSRRYWFNTSNAQWGPREIAPGPRAQSDEQLGAFLSQTLSPTEFHPAGTCAMLPRRLGGVVDEGLRVYGVERLRVVDASVMPTLPGGNTCQTVYALAEKVTKPFIFFLSSGGPLYLPGSRARLS